MGFGRVRGKRACGFSFWSNTRLSHPYRLLRVVIHAKDCEFSTIVVVYDFSQTSTVCGVFEVDGIKFWFFVSV